MSIIGKKNDKMVPFDPGRVNELVGRDLFSLDRLFDNFRSAFDDVLLTPPGP